MHLLPLEYVYQLHLLLERLHQLVPLSFQLPVLLKQPIHVLAQGISLGDFRGFGFLELLLVAFQFFDGTVEFSILGTAFLDGLLLVSLDCVNFLGLLGKGLLEGGDLGLEVGVELLDLLKLLSALVQFIVELLGVFLELLVLPLKVFTLALLLALSLDQLLHLRVHGRYFRLLEAYDLFLLLVLLQHLPVPLHFAQRRVEFLFKSVISLLSLGVRLPYTLGFLYQVAS